MGGGLEGGASVGGVWGCAGLGGGEVEGRGQEQEHSAGQVACGGEGGGGGGGVLMGGLVGAPGYNII